MNGTEHSSDSDSRMSGSLYTLNKVWQFSGERNMIK